MELQKKAEEILAALSRQNLKLAIAESATGGYVSHLLTNISGCSKTLIGSVVCYTASAKNILLDVDWDIINN